MNKLLNSIIITRFFVKPIMYPGINRTCMYTIPIAFKPFLDYILEPVLMQNTYYMYRNKAKFILPVHLVPFTKHLRSAIHLLEREPQLLPTIINTVVTIIPNPITLEELCLLKSICTDDNWYKRVPIILHD